MAKQEAKERIEKLKQEINYHRYLYHVLDRSEISDAALDSIKRELVQLERQYPEFITLDSPTQRVGGQPLAKFRKVAHSAPMLSLEDAFSEDDMRDWRERIRKVHPGGRYEYFAELKIDGFAISLIYEKGVLKEGSTRGDGLIGEDVTENLKTIESIPLKLVDPEEYAKNSIFKRPIGKSIQIPKSRVFQGILEVRGEVFMSKKVFEEINKERGKSGEPLYANPRNTAAGSIRQLDPRVAASRKLEFLSYDLVTDIGQKCHSDKHKILRALGFKTDALARECASLEAVFDFYREIEKKRPVLKHMIDGIVVSVDDNVTFQRLGVIGKAPRGAVAFKFPAEEATTVVRDIAVQVGRTGALTPVARMEPVAIGGTVVSHATLHNQDEIARLGLKIGDTVIVKRAGDVIPKITGVLKNLRTGREKEFKMPKLCPVCGEPVVQRAGEVAFRCVSKKCPAKNKEVLAHFVSKKAFNIIGLGDKILERFSELGLVSDPADIFFLEKADIAPLERFGEKSADNIIASIEAGKKIALAKFIFSLGIVHVGEETAQLLAKQVITKIKTRKPEIKVSVILNLFQDLSQDDLQKIPDVGPKVARSFYDYFHSAYAARLLQKLEQAGIIIELPKAETRAQTLKGISFVLTGEMESMSRDEAKDRIRERGGEAQSDVSSRTAFVVAGRNPGSKYDRAKKLGIKILDEEEFLKIIKSS